MRRFRFRLDSLLRVRSQVERTARKALAVAMAEVHTFDQQLEAASRGLADCEAQAARADSVGHLARGLEDGLRRHRWRLTRQREQAEQRLEAVRVDYTEKARELIEKEQVAAVFGCWTSVSRKSVLPVFEELNGLLFYPVQYEGEESSRNVFYTGAAPNQQALPADE